MTTKEKAWMDRVAQLGCICCQHFGQGATPATLHHVREGQGMSQRAKHWLVVPLCKHHHQGNEGIHSGTFYRRYKLDEMDLLAFTLEALYG